MKKRLIPIGLVAGVVGLVYLFGNWHFEKKITDIIEQVELAGNSNLDWRQEPSTNLNETNLIDLTIEFSYVFEEIYQKFEKAINQLLYEAKWEYQLKVAEGKDGHEVIQKYQSKFLEVEQLWSNEFWYQYGLLQEELEQADYYRDNAIEFEIEFELRREQTTHAFLQALMRMYD
ncbi:hypothetical protein JCM9140_3342 [Halalkalibacter wakoensis JCM 9140]|uniref:Uncharacterized protein n=1 Tax=Halalkalibacter wakoensis JCM 9140 TaxID=1236970 RepID=W4Q752_9BACI|nr:hypothetical protein [Halalkalibacter wakoensis]GAE27214.1 hypothetical protein JCM9140_3342 [Halalkalibacter wakoensis JCM 9140]